MKDLVKKAQSFITFDSQLEIAPIRALFATTHGQQQARIPNWTAISTRQKLISHYWFTQVFGHFALILALPVMVALWTSRTIEPGLILVILATAGLSFMVLLLTNYLPAFMRDFLPKLETVTQEYNQAQSELELAQLQLAVDQQKKEILRLKAVISQQVEEAQKCREAQLSNLALVLIYYVFSKKAGISNLEVNSKTSNLLMQLYGISPVSIRENLELIAGAGEKRKKLTGRKYTETKSRFEEAYEFFENQKFPEGVQVLKTLEMQIFSSR